MKKFAHRHIGPDSSQIATMLEVLQLDDLDTLIDLTVPKSIRSSRPLDISPARPEFDYHLHLRQLAKKNKLNKSYIGQGYYGTITPAPIQRNIWENPGWYTQYTPYQAEIAQGRLEALLNFQTMVSDLTALPIANASLLDEATAAAEAMSMFYSIRNKRNDDQAADVFLVDQHVFPQTIDVLKTRAAPLGIRILVGDWKAFTIDDHVFGALVQYPNGAGAIEDYRDLVNQLHSAGAFITVAADILSLALLTPPGEWGADASVGSTQRMGVPLGFGGPHAAYFATHERFKRQIPGRIIGVSKDINGTPALRMALQTREQHIRREKATSNICTAQALLAIMASMYAVYHGPVGIRDIAATIAKRTNVLGKKLTADGIKVAHQSFFDTLRIEEDEATLEGILRRAREADLNLFLQQDAIQVSIDESTSLHDLQILCNVLTGKNSSIALDFDEMAIPKEHRRDSDILTHPIFNRYHTETKLMRYMKSLENKDLSLVHAMIPLGSCTMKLNAASQLMPLTWPEFSHMHPFAPLDQAKGYLEMISSLARDLCEITGLAACSFQPNSGAQGEYAGLMAIRGYHQANGEHQRNVTLIPSSAHGTNPASAVMAGMKVVIVTCDEDGNIDLDDLQAKLEIHAPALAALMVTYPSTHGVFEESISEICRLIHEHGGLVYLDGANMNAQVGLTSPGLIGADVCHLNLHKTFAIPHGGGGPGMGPICVNEKLSPYLPGHVYTGASSKRKSTAVSAAPYGSASILLISYGYIKMLGEEGLTAASKIAILNANYISHRLSRHYDILYLGIAGYCAHELILDLRPFKSLGVGAEDVAKRLIDYGFHAPTLSFPVTGTLMIEPTESEDLEELDRFCEAMIAIKAEIDEIARGEYPAESNVLVHAPHTIESVSDDSWTYPYSREKAAFPLPWLRSGHKFWAAVRRVDNVYGDRTLVCTCPPIESYQ
ncbi:MAG: aminomethyl-transferring glycine dehydrogenase [Saprospiraceae bacterium]|nr:aminomethyl-transferring glycine dehydrogenase [Saprospiraceae bacterium]